jgi:hypothetical protein
MCSASGSCDYFNQTCSPKLEQQIALIAIKYKTTLLGPEGFRAGKPLLTGAWLKNSRTKQDAAE